MCTIAVIRACVPKNDGTKAIGIYLPGLSTFMKINQKNFKKLYFYSKVGGNIKITEVFKGRVYS